MKKQNIYLLLNIFLFLLLSAIIYDRLQLAKEVKNLKEDIDRINEENKFKIKVIEESYQLQLKELESYKTKYEKLSDREEKKLELYYGNLYKYKFGDNYFRNSPVRKFRIDGNKINVTIENNGSQPIKPDFTIYFLNENGFVTATYSDVYIFSSVSPGETRISDGNINFRYGTPIYYSLNESY